MVNKPFLYLKELDALGIGKMIPEPELDKKTQKKFDKFLKELRYYEHCDVKFGEMCKHPRCINAILELKDNSDVIFKCGRLL